MLYSSRELCLQKFITINEENSVSIYAIAVGSFGFQTMKYSEHGFITPFQNNTKQQGRYVRKKPVIMQTNKTS